MLKDTLRILWKTDLETQIHFLEVYYLFQNELHDK